MIPGLGTVNINKKRAFNEDVVDASRVKISTDLGRRTGDFGPLHPVLCNGYNDAWSRFSEVPECVLAMVLSPYIFAPDGRSIVPGLISLKPGQGAPPVLEEHRFDRAPNPLFDSVIEVTPCNDILMFTADRKKLGRPCSRREDMVCEPINSQTLATRRLKFVRLICECNEMDGADPRQITLTTQARYKDPYSQISSIADIVDYTYREWTGDGISYHGTLPPLLDTLSRGLAIFLHAVCTDGRGTVCIAFSRFLDPPKIAIMRREPDKLVEIQQFGVGKMQFVLAMRVDVRGDLVVFGQYKKTDFLTGTETKQRIRIFKTREL